jgi:hypothetical protein
MLVSLQEIYIYINQVSLSKTVYLVLVLKGEAGNPS